MNLKLSNYKMKRDIDDIQDKNDRSSPLGLYNVADSYWAAASFLMNHNLESTHRDSPIYFLFYHSIELFLKSYLRLNGISISDLANPKKYGHRVCCLVEKATEFGLRFGDEEFQVFSLMTTTDAVIRSRYFERGFYRWPTHEALNRTCKGLSELVGDAFRKTGTDVRMIDRLVQKSLPHHSPLA